MHLDAPWDMNKAKGALMVLSTSTVCWAIAIGAFVLRNYVVRAAKSFRQYDEAISPGICNAS